MIVFLTRFEVHYVPGDANVDITLETLEVEEGGGRAITPRHLSIRVASAPASFLFNVTRGPAHGALHVTDAQGVATVRENATFFTSEEVAANRLVYRVREPEQIYVP